MPYGVQKVVEGSNHVVETRGRNRRFGSADKRGPLTLFRCISGKIRCQCHRCCNRHCCTATIKRCPDRRQKICPIEFKQGGQHPEIVKILHSAVGNSKGY